MEEIGGNRLPIKPNKLPNRLPSKSNRHRATQRCHHPQTVQHNKFRPLGTTRMLPPSVSTSQMYIKIRFMEGITQL